MSRPKKCRLVAFMPGVTYFKPAATPLRFLKEVQLTIEEVEAIRLKDIEGLEQQQCAEKMQVSRATFQRVLGSARKKVAEALMNGKAIKIEGGNFNVEPVCFTCSMGHAWDAKYTFGLAEANADTRCPICGLSGVSGDPRGKATEKNRPQKFIRL
jgi:predicted DNA-binding protein (UPF0251 family)